MPRNEICTKGRKSDCQGAPGRKTRKLARLFHKTTIILPILTTFSGTIWRNSSRRVATAFRWCVPALFTRLALLNGGLCRQQAAAVLEALRRSGKRVPNAGRTCACGRFPGSTRGRRWSAVSQRPHSVETVATTSRSPAHRLGEPPPPACHGAATAAPSGRQAPYLTPPSSKWKAAR